MTKKSIIIYLSLLISILFITPQNAYADCAIGSCGESGLGMFIYYLSEPEFALFRIAILSVAVLSFAGLIIIRKRKL